jgi:drug/metabolite transporter (DMT)-like permease
MKGGDEKQGMFMSGVAVVLLVVIAVAKTQLTAFLFSSASYPTAYSLYSTVVTCVMLVPVFVIKPSTWAMPTPAMLTNFLTVVAFTAGDLGLTNVALDAIATAVQGSIAATNPFWCIIIESVLYKKFQHWLVYIVVTLVAVGAVFVSLGTGTVTVIGIAAAVIAVLCSASKYVFAHKGFKESQGKLGAMAMLFWVDLFLIPIFLVWLGIAALAGNNELVEMIEVMGDWKVFVQMTLTAGLGGVRALSQYFVLVFMTATSMSVANIFTQIFNILISIPIQHTAVTAYSIVGIVLVCIASPTYMYFKIDKEALPAVDKALGCSKEESPKV